MEPLTTVQVPTFAVQVPGNATRFALSEMVAVAGIIEPVVLVNVAEPLSMSPGPVQPTSVNATAPGIRWTVTVNAQVVGAAPAAVQVTVVVPAGKDVPEAGVQVTVPQAPLVVGAG